jgi:nucleoside diphosphate kinase
MKKENHYTFLLLKPSTLRRTGFFWNHKVADDIINFIQKHNFKIISKKKVNITNTDIIRLYHEDINKTKIDNRNNAVKMFNSYKKTLKKNYCTLLLLYHENKNAKDFLSEIKGHNFNPSLCNHDTIRYIFRNKKWDSIKIVPGEFLDSNIMPDDNVVHAPRNESEFNPIINKYLKHEWNLILRE